LRIDGANPPAEARAARRGGDQAALLFDSDRGAEAGVREERELDLSFGIKNLSRFRANMFMQRGAVSAAFRSIRSGFSPSRRLGLRPSWPSSLSSRTGWCSSPGRPESGKTTTLASIIDKINNETRVHIMTIEDRSSTFHPHKLSIVNQREVGSDTSTFKTALKYVLRQDPDVVLIGEMRDLETIEAALTIAETGHLGLSPRCTRARAPRRLNRIVDVFPPHQQQQIRAQLSLVLQGVVTQLLLPRAVSGARPRARDHDSERAIRNLIREDKVHQIYSSMQVGQESTECRR